MWNKKKETFREKQSWFLARDHVLGISENQDMILHFMQSLARVRRSRVAVETRAGLSVGCLSFKPCLIFTPWFMNAKSTFTYCYTSLASLILNVLSSLGFFYWGGWVGVGEFCSLIGFRNRALLIGSDSHVTLLEWIRLIHFISTHRLASSHRKRCAKGVVFCIFVAMYLFIDLFFKRGSQQVSYVKNVF